MEYFRVFKGESCPPCWQLNEKVRELKIYLTSSLNGRDAQQDGEMLNAHMLFSSRLKGTSADI